MRRAKFLAASLAAALLLSASTWAEVSGDYVETRSADVYTGQCFANGEMGLTGDQAILGWHVNKGEWNGVALDGLNVVGAVKARATLGDPYGNPYPAKSVVIVDDRATPAQRQALLGFVRHMGGELFANVVRVETAPIEIAVSPDHARHGSALMRAGQLATLRTRSLNENDHLCGNEETFYPPLTDVTHSVPAVAVTDAYNGPGLGVTWRAHDRRSAFVGTFSASERVQSVALANR
ncbi:MAG TPA: DUF1326 domain-containing protein [Terriglobales bacterium]|nr:DUF1326 domain-containing protein [Terriglobales bacterium]